MKKIALTVSEPCHQNWDAMTPEQKGRFCSSYQKTVVDFTAMSDRQIAEYFKEAVGSTCGRFYNDQLNRPLEVPKKRVSLLRYFFQFTWPAFLLLLKSCGQKNDVQGKVFVEEKTLGKSLRTTGIVLREITPVDTFPIVPMEESKLDACTMVVGDFGIKAEARIDTSAQMIVEPKKVDTIQAAGFDEITTVGDTTVIQPTDTLPAKVLGAFGGAKIKSLLSNGVSHLQRNIGPQTSAAPVLYPNPVRAGQQMSVGNVKTVNGTYAVISLAGQMLTRGKLTITENQFFTISIGQWPAGTYLLQLTDEAGRNSHTQKFIVL